MPPKKLVIDDTGDKLPADFNRSKVAILEVPQGYRLPTGFAPQNLKKIIVRFGWGIKSAKEYSPSMTLYEVQKFIDYPEPRDCATGSFWAYDVNILNDQELSEVFSFYNIKRRSKNISPQEKCNVIKKFSPSEQWRRETEKYMLALPEIEKKVIDAYTRVGDRVLNEFYRRGLASAIALIRKEDLFPFGFIFLDFLNFLRENNTLSVGGHGVLLKNDLVRGKNTQEKIEALEERTLMTLSDRHNRGLVRALSDFSLAYCILAFAQYFINIFKKVPPLDKDILLFRGIRVDLFEKERRFKTLGFSSTSNNPLIAWAFSKGDYVLRLLVPKGTRCVPIFGSLLEEGIFKSTLSSESEILFPSGTILALEGCVENEDEEKLCDVGVTENIEDLDCQKIAGDWKAMPKARPKTRVKARPKKTGEKTAKARAKNGESAGEKRRKSGRKKAKARAKNGESAGEMILREDPL